MKLTKSCLAVIALFVFASTSFAAKKEPPAILASTVQQIDDVSHSINMTGENFLCGSPDTLIVKVGGYAVDTFSNATDTQLLFTTPFEIVNPGTYLVTISNFCGDVNYELTIGSVGPQGPEGPEGQRGEDLTLEILELTGKVCDLYVTLNQPIPLICSNCGNGSVEYLEECDDGNSVGGDGCSSSCTSEICGNGTLEGNEECDDGNLTSGDGCDSYCMEENYTFASTDVPITTKDMGSVYSQVSVNAPVAAINGIKVTVDITHTYTGDLTITLIPNGGDPVYDKGVTLFSKYGGSGDNLTQTTFDDNASIPIYQGAPPFTGSFVPSESLSDILGRDPDGIWHLRVTDAYAGDSGSLNSWNITIW